jgi:hypothetical protein
MLERGMITLSLQDPDLKENQDESKNQSKSGRRFSQRPDTQTIGEDYEDQNKCESGG